MSAACNRRCDFNSFRIRYSIADMASHVPTIAIIEYSIPVPHPFFMAGTFKLQVVTPEREVFNGEVDSVTLPGMESRFGVLRSHAPMIAALTSGHVDIVDGNGQDIRMAVGGGFFQVADNVAMILADSAETAVDINLERARESESRAKSRLAGQVVGQMDEGFQLERSRAEAALKRAQNRLRIAGIR